MSDVIEYTRVFFSEPVHLAGHGKRVRSDADLHTRIYRDMADPNTLVVYNAHRKVYDEVPWSAVRGAHRKPQAEKPVQAEQQVIAAAKDGRADKGKR